MSYPGCLIRSRLHTHYLAALSTKQKGKWLKQMTQCHVPTNNSNTAQHDTALHLATIQPVPTTTPLSTVGRTLCGAVANVRYSPFARGSARCIGRNAFITWQALPHTLIAKVVFITGRRPRTAKGWQAGDVSAVGL